MGQSLERPIVSPQAFALQHTVKELLPSSLGSAPVHYDTRRMQCVLCGYVPKSRSRLDLETMTCQATKACASRMREGARE